MTASFTDYVPECLVVKAPRGKFEPRPVQKMNVRLVRMGFPAPGDGERVISRWTIELGKALAEIDAENRGALDANASRLAPHVLAEGEWVALLTNRSLRLACTNGTGRFGRLLGGWNVRTTTGEHRMFHIVWPLETIDAISLDPEQGRNQDLLISRHAPSAAFILIKAHRADDSFIANGIGLKSQTTEFAAEIIAATADVQRSSADPRRAGTAGRIQHGHRDRKRTAVVADFRAGQ